MLYFAIFCLFRRSFQQKDNAKITFFNQNADSFNKKSLPLHTLKKNNINKWTTITRKIRICNVGGCSAKKQSPTLLNPLETILYENILEHQLYS